MCQSINGTHTEAYLRGAVPKPISDSISFTSAVGDLEGIFVNSLQIPRVIIIERNYLHSQNWSLHLRAHQTPIFAHHIPCNSQITPENLNPLYFCFSSPHPPPSLLSLPAPPPFSPLLSSFISSFLPPLFLSYSSSSSSLLPLLSSSASLPSSGQLWPSGPRRRRHCNRSPPLLPPPYPL